MDLLVWSGYGSLLRVFVHSQVGTDIPSGGGDSPIANWSLWTLSAALLYSGHGKVYLRYSAELARDRPSSETG
jgi:hypothetical protein